MKKVVFRLLTPKEIECRVGSGGTQKDNFCILLLYKDARVDQKILDEEFGPFGWKRSHRLIGDRLYCEVSVRNDETGEWISKEDVGTESNTEKEKGQASDAFKRACFNWGIGRELYTAPFVYIPLESSEFKNGRLATKFSVSEIGYNDDREINKLVIVDNKGNVRYSLGSKAKAKKAETKEKKVVVDPLDTLSVALGRITLCKSKEDLLKVWADFTGLHNNSEFTNAMTTKKKDLGIQ